MGDLTDNTNERELHEDEDEDEDEYCMDCGQLIDYCRCGYYIPDLG